MKTKKGFVVKTISIIASVALLVLGTLGFIFNNKKQSALSGINANFVANNEFTAIDTNHLVFNMEKVGVIATNNSNDLTTELYTDSSATTLLENYNISGKEKGNTEDGKDKTYYNYYYQPISNGINGEKYIVKNGEFVMLNNSYNSAKSYYTSGNIKPTYDSAGNRVDMQEAIMLSFGQFVYNDAQKSYDIAGENSGANITMLNPVITCNGSAPKIVLNRQYGEGLYSDFSYIIPQTPENEGYWSINLNYFYNGTEYNASFNFYLIFNTSYTGNVIEKNADNLAYGASPNILCDGKTLSEAGGAYQYHLAYNSSYPVLTYDYTKYRMSYTHTANGKTTKYSYNLASGATTNNAKLTVVATGAEAGTKTYTMEKYNNSHTNQLVSILFTDLGDYDFSFEYIYTGYNAVNSPAMNLKIANQRLRINGATINYINRSERSQMKYVTLSKNSNLEYVDFIAPNAYLLNSTPTLNGLIVDYNSSSTARLGTTLSTQGGDYNKTMNSYLNENPLDATNTINSVNMFANSVKGGTNNLTGLAQLQNYLKNNKAYTRTNQGPITIRSNEAYDWANSFYFYSKNTYDIFKTLDDNKFENYYAFTPQTGFEEVGYYLVFIKLATSNEYMLFAFQYNTDASNVTLQTVDTNYTLYSGEFTNQDVKISWTKRGVFERNISVLISGTAGEFVRQTDISKLATLEGDTYSYVVEFNPYASVGYSHFDVLLNIEGSSSVLTQFTIDKEPISGINVYEVKKYTNILGNTDYEYIISSTTGERIPIERVTATNGAILNEGAVTNGWGGLYWNNKNSGADIKVTYTVTEFVKSDEPASEQQVGNYVWHNTPYKLGATSNTIYDITSNSDINVLSNQGIYLFTFTDLAGNSCKYMFIVDKTENYLKVTDKEGNSTFASKNSLTYYDDITIGFGSHKTILLNLDNNQISQELKDVITLAGNNGDVNNYANLNYYTLGKNYQSLNNLFTTTTDGNIYYTLRNRSLYAYDYTGVQDKLLTKENISLLNNFSLNMNYVDSNTSSMIRMFYLMGVNNRLSMENGSSNINIEINKDNSRGTVYYSNNESYFEDEREIIKATNDINNANIYRLFTGKDTATGDKGIDVAQATSDDFVVFTWFEGEGSTQVKNVSYKYYDLNNSFDEEFYYYNYASEVDLFKTNEDGSTTVSTTVKRFVDENGKVRYYAMLNKVSGKTRDGLYVVTRSYESETLNYYFIVDRNNIIELGSANASIIGSNIYLSLMEETKFDSFNSYNTKTEHLKNDEDNLDLDYRLYLNNSDATKLPAVWNVPISKYFNGKDLSKYYAGRLNIALYFNDTNNQLNYLYEEGRKPTSFKLYENTVDDFANIDNNIFNIDVTRNLPNNLKNYFLTTKGNTSWITLPGDYILVISDVVKSSNGSHQKVIGFRINGNAGLIPNADVYSTNNRTDMPGAVTPNNKAELINGKYYLTTNKEFVKLDIPIYDTNSFNAGLDNANIEIYRTIGANKQTYLKIANGIVDRNSIVNSNNYTFDKESGALSVILTTNLRNGSYIAPDFEKSIKYEIVVNYKSKEPTAYYYYTDIGTRQYYNTAKYTVVIDREAPKANITALQQGDDFKNYYTNGNLFVDDHTNNPQGEDNVFVTRYKEYPTNASEIGKVYAFKVNSSTAFNNDDVSKIYINKIENISSYSLADLFTGGYYTYTQLDAQDIGLYGDLFDNAGYYEVIEADACNNLTQYLVFYDNETDSYDKIKLNLTYSGVKIKSGITTVGETTAMLGADSEESGSLIVHNFIGLTILDMGDVYDSYYRFELVNRASNEIVEFINTSLSDNFETVAQNILNMFTKAGYGNYNLIIRTRSQTYIHRINYYESHQLSASKMVVQSNGNYYLYLNNANEEVSGAFYYVTEIKITSENGNEQVYVCDESTLSTDDNGKKVIKYYLKNDVNKVYQDVVSLGKGNYSVRITDCNGNTDACPVGDAFTHSIRVENDKTPYLNNNCYYAFDTTTIIFNPLFFTAKVSYSINKGSILDAEVNITDYITVDQTTGRVVIYPYFAQQAGGLIEATVSIVSKESGIWQGKDYKVVLDTRFGNSATLVDSDGKSTEGVLVFDKNVDYTSTDAGKQATGTRYLIWTNANNTELNSAFNFKYTLYEQLKSGEFNISNLNEENRATIEPSENSANLFRFVIDVYSPEGEYMGNVVYTFLVQATASELYTVYAGNNVIAANAYITLAELLNDASLNVTAREILNEWQRTGGISLSENNLPSLNLKIPLYVYNRAMRVGEADNSVKATYTLEVSNIIFNLYRVSKVSDVQYVATLQVEEYSNFISNLQINGTAYNRNGQTLSGAENYVLTFARRFNSLNDSSNVLSQKDVLKMDLFYYDTFVKTVTFNDLYSYEFTASGRYGIIFRDLAGNIAELNFSVLGVTSEQMIVTILKEVAVLVNGQAPISNGYYNGTVSIVVQNPSAYNKDSIVVSYARNAGEQTNITSTNYTYNFTKLGWYKVIFNAIIGGKTISKTVEFTIINPNEAYSNISLNNKYINITNVVNTRGEDITEQFKTLLNLNNGVLSYNLIIENSSLLGVGYGKQMFTVTYESLDNNYPKRVITFSFTMNNEIPNLNCNLSAGASSTKGFSITFNAGEIYRQVGDCTIYVYKNSIGGKVDYTFDVTAKSASEITKYNKYRNGTEDDGAYYIVLQSLSGNLISSSKVYIKEPLNSWANIVIVVVSVIVVAIIVAVILLRRRMRIR